MVYWHDMSPVHKERDPRWTKPEEKPLREARSQAELTRVKQGWAMIILQILALVGTGLVVASQFGLI